MPEDQLQLQALDTIAAMVYQTQLNLDCLNGKIKVLKQSPLKDVIICYIENQKDWMAKFHRGLKRIGLLEVMQKDLSSTELAYYSIICEFARQSKDMEGLSDLMEAANDIEDLGPVLTQVKALLFNYKNK